MNEKIVHNLSKYLDINLDNEIQKISYLNWLPWVGIDYCNSKNKILLVGESNYGDSESSLTEQSINVNYSREIVAEMPINRWYYKKNKFYPNLHNAIIGHDKFNTIPFWSEISFYNFIQQSMNYIGKRREQPTATDFVESWQIFYRLIDILRPNTIIFLGLSSVINYQTDNLNKWQKVSFNKLNKVGSNYPRIIKLNNKENHEVKIIFIRHPSQYFSHIKWHTFLSEQIPDEIKWLKSIVI